MKIASLFLFSILFFSMGAWAGGANSEPLSLFSGISPDEQSSDLITTCSKKAKQDEESRNGFSILAAEAKAISAAYETCAANANLAQKACLESLSPNIGQAAGILGGMASAASQSRSAADLCKNDGGALDKAKMAMMAYNAACSGAKATCDMITCPKVKTVIAAQLKSAQAKVDAERSTCSSTGNCAKSDLLEFTEMPKLEAYSKQATTGGECFKTGCQKYATQLASALGSIAQMVVQSEASKNCEKAVTNKPPEGPVDCSKPENNSNSFCICQKNPRQAGCPETSGTLAEVNKSIGSGTKNGISGLNGVPSIPYSDLANQQPTGGGADSGSAGGSGGGGGAGGGSRGGFGGGSGLSASGTNGGKLAPNTNIYGGDSGGGGGGRGSGAGYDDKYGKYAPTVAQARKLASGGIGEISGKSGKSNWEKVKDRYSENRTKLINK